MTAVVLRFVLAWLFVLAGAGKVLHRPAFAAAVSGYQLLPDRLVRPVALGVPALELASGLLLAAGVLVRLVAVGLAVLLSIFMGAMIVNLLQGRRIPCGCLGSIERPISWLVVGRNTALLTIAVFIALRSPASAVPQQSISGPPATLVAAMLASLVILISALVAAGVSTLQTAESFSSWAAGDQR